MIFFFLWLGFIRYVFCALKTQHGQLWIHNCQIYYSFIFTILTRNSFCFILFFFLSVSSPRIIYALLHLEYWVFMLSFARFYVWFLVNHFRSYDRTTTKKLTISHTKEAEKKVSRIISVATTITNFILNNKRRFIVVRRFFFGSICKNYGKKVQYKYVWRTIKK